MADTTENQPVNIAVADTFAKAFMDFGGRTCWHGFIGEAGAETHVVTSLQVAELAEARVEETREDFFQLSHGERSVLVAEEIMRMREEG